MKSTMLAGMMIRNNLGLPSGIVGTKVSIIERLANEIPQLGFVVTKSTNFGGKDGHKAPIIASVSNGSLINAVGLANDGAEALARELSTAKFPKGFLVIGSVFGATVKDCVNAARQIVPYVGAIEMNFSCPHDEKQGLQVGQDINLVVEITKEVVKLGKPVFEKVSPKMDLEVFVKATRDLGIAGYSVINTYGPENFEVDKWPVLTNKVGGISGRKLTEMMLECTAVVRQHTLLDIITSGGISRRHDVENALNAGGTVCAIGTATMGLNTPELADYFGILDSDLTTNSHNAEIWLNMKHYPVENAMKYGQYFVEENEKLASGLHKITFDKVLISRPGQFIFVWIPGLGERPFSILDNQPLKILVAVRGKCTEFLSKLEPGKSVMVRGPHGSEPKLLGEKILLVAGGTGAAALRQFAEDYCNKINFTAVLGAKDEKHLYIEGFVPFCNGVYLFTENGDPKTTRGLVTDKLDKIMEKDDFDFCLTCGPKPMVKKVFEIAEKFLPSKRILGSVEFHTDCGIGLCGKDATPTGLRPCVDGTFMTKEQLGL